MFSVFLLKRVLLLLWPLQQRIDSLTSQLADRDNQLAAVRRQVEEKDTTLRARDAQVCVQA